MLFMAIGVPTYRALPEGLEEEVVGGEYGVEDSYDDDDFEGDDFEEVVDEVEENYELQEQFDTVRSNEQLQDEQPSAPLETPSNLRLAGPQQVRIDNSGQFVVDATVEFDAEFTPGAEYEYRITKV